MDSKHAETEPEHDIEATSNELKGVLYTALSFVTLVIAIIGSLVYAVL